MLKRGMSVLLLLVLLFTANAFSDIYMKQKQHTDAVTIMGQSQPAEDVISETWITPEKIAVMNENHKIVIDLQKKTVTMADHKSKTLTVIPMDFSKMSEGSGMSADEQTQMQNFMGNMFKLDLKIEPTDEHKKIGEWDCRKYNQTMEMGMGTSHSVIWATKEIHIDKDLYAKYVSGMMAQMPGISQNLDTVMKELEKIDGVQVLSEQTMDMMGQSFGSSSELLEYKEAKAPADAFTLPSGYKQQNPFQR